MIGPDRFRPLVRLASTGAVLFLALVSFSASARCEVSVQGTASAVRIDARKARLAEVLRELGANFKVRHETLIALDEVIISGTYLGTLEDVLRRMLTGLNYVIKAREGTVEIMIVGRPGDTPAGIAPPAPPALPTNTNPAAQWRIPAAQKP
jgi:hypothetical protein